MSRKLLLSLLIVAAIVGGITVAPKVLKGLRLKGEIITTTRTLAISEQVGVSTGDTADISPSLGDISVDGSTGTGTAGCIPDGLANVTIKYPDGTTEQPAAAQGNNTFSIKNADTISDAEVTLSCRKGEKSSQAEYHISFIHTTSTSESTPVQPDAPQTHHADDVTVRDLGDKILFYYPNDTDNKAPKNFQPLIIENPKNRYYTITFTVPANMKALTFNLNGACQQQSANVVSGNLGNCTITARSIATSSENITLEALVTATDDGSSKKDAISYTTKTISEPPVLSGIPLLTKDGGEGRVDNRAISFIDGILTVEVKTPDNPGVKLDVSLINVIDNDGQKAYDFAKSESLGDDTYSIAVPRYAVEHPERFQLRLETDGVTTTGFLIPQAKAEDSKSISRSDIFTLLNQSGKGILIVNNKPKFFEDSHLSDFSLTGEDINERFSLPESAPGNSQSFVLEPGFFNVIKGVDIRLKSSADCVLEINSSGNKFETTDHAIVGRKRFEVKLGKVTICTFTNSAPTTPPQTSETGQDITIIKEVIGENNQNTPFNFEINKFNPEKNKEEQEASPFSLLNRQEKKFRLVPGIYILEEENKNGYEIKSIICNSSARGVFEFKQFIISAQVALEANEHVTCTFTNKKIAQTAATQSSTSNDNAGGDTSVCKGSPADMSYEMLEQGKIKITAGKKQLIVGYPTWATVPDSAAGETTLKSKSEKNANNNEVTSWLTDETNQNITRVRVKVSLYCEGKTMTWEKIFNRADLANTPSPTPPLAQTSSSNETPPTASGNEKINCDTSRAKDAAGAPITSTDASRSGGRTFERGRVPYIIQGRNECAVVAVTGQLIFLGFTRSTVAQMMDELKTDMHWNVDDGVVMSEFIKGKEAYFKKNSDRPFEVHRIGGGLEINANGYVINDEKSDIVRKIAEERKKGQGIEIYLSFAKKDKNGNKLQRSLGHMVGFVDADFSGANPSIDIMNSNAENGGQQRYIVRGRELVNYSLDYAVFIESAFAQSPINPTVTVSNPPTPTAPPSTAEQKKDIEREISKVVQDSKRAKEIGEDMFRAMISGFSGVDDRSTNSIMLQISPNTDDPPQIESILNDLGKLHCFAQHVPKNNFIPSALADCDLSVSIQVPNLPLGQQNVYLLFAIQGKIFPLQTIPITIVPNLFNANFSTESKNPIKNSDGTASVIFSEGAPLTGMKTLQPTTATPITLKQLDAPPAPLILPGLSFTPLTVINIEGSKGPAVLDLSSKIDKTDPNKIYACYRLEDNGSWTRFPVVDGVCRPDHTSTFMIVEEKKVIPPTAQPPAKNNPPVNQPAAGGGVSYGAIGNTAPITSNNSSTGSAPVPNIPLSGINPPAMKGAAASPVMANIILYSVAGKPAKATLTEELKKAGLVGMEVTGALKGFSILVSVSSMLPEKTKALPNTVVLHKVVSMNTTVKWKKQTITFVLNKADLQGKKVKDISTLTLEKGVWKKPVVKDVTENKDGSISLTLETSNPLLAITWKKK